MLTFQLILKFSYSFPENFIGSFSSCCVRAVAYQHSSCCIPFDMNFLNPIHGSRRHKRDKTCIGNLYQWSQNRAKKLGALIDSLIATSSEVLPSWMKLWFFWFFLKIKLVKRNVKRNQNFHESSSINCSHLRI